MESTHTRSMPAEYAKKLHRLLRIIQLIQAAPTPAAGADAGWTAKRLALELGVGIRTVYRDLKDLAAAGIPHFFDPEAQSYAIHRDFFMPPVQLSLDESLALVALAERVGKDEQIPMLKPAGKAISKIRAILPPSIRDELAPLDDRLAIKLGPTSAPEAWQDVYVRIRSAVSRRRVLTCVYESPGKSLKASPEQSFEFHPYLLMFNQRAWYAIGYHSKHRAIRSLKLQRFVRCDLTNVAFKVPPNFSLAKHLGNAWRMIRGKESFDIHLRFSPEFADTISDTHWHPTQQEELNEDGSLELKFTVDGLDEIVWWVMSMGPHCTVLSPTQLAERVRELASKTAAIYDTPKI